MCLKEKHWRCPPNRSSATCFSVKMTSCSAHILAAMLIPLAAAGLTIASTFSILFPSALFRSPRHNQTEVQCCSFKSDLMKGWKSGKLRRRKTAIWLPCELRSSVIPSVCPTLAPTTCEPGKIYFFFCRQGFPSLNAWIHYSICLHCRVVFLSPCGGRRINRKEGTQPRFKVLLLLL